MILQAKAISSVEINHPIHATREMGNDRDGERE